MQITPIKTPYFTLGEPLENFLKAYLPQFQEGSIIAITSKIISLSQKRLIDSDLFTLEEILQKNCTWVKKIPQIDNTYLTMYNDRLLLNAGVDTSNIKEGYLLLPINPFNVAQEIGNFLTEVFNIQNLGILITDSRSLPFVRGSVGFPIAWWGFQALNSLANSQDLTGKPLRVTEQNVVQALASGAVFVMGEAAECTPLAILKDVPHLKFTNRRPSPKEIKSVFISVDEDIYLRSCAFQK